MSKIKQAREWVNGYALTGTGIVVAAIVPGSTSIALMTIEATLSFIQLKVACVFIYL